jgi:hypothetical protein
LQIKFGREVKKMKNTILVISVIAILMIMFIGTVSAACASCSGKAAAADQTKTGWKGKLFNDTFRKEIRQDALQIRGQMQACKENQSAECNQTRQKAINTSKELLKDVAGTLCTKLDKMEEKVNGIEKLTEDEKSSVLEAIDEAQEKCSELEAKIDAATNKSEIKGIIAEIRNLVKAVHVKAVEMIKMKRVGLIVERAEHLETRLNKTIEKANEANISTDELESLVDDFNAKIAEARASYNESRDLWTQAFEMIENNTIDGRPELIQQAHDKMQEAQASLKEAHAILKEIVAKIREMKVEVAEENETVK